MLLIVGCCADRPEVRLHRLFAAGSVLLSEEGSLVGRDVLQVVLTFSNGCRNGCETSTNCQLFVGWKGRARDRTQAAEIDAGAVRRSGWCFTVGGEHHLLVLRMGRLLVDFVQRTADGFEHRCIRGFCHSRSAIGSQRPIPLR